MKGMQVTAEFMPWDRGRLLLNLSQISSVYEETVSAAIGGPPLSQPQQRLLVVCYAGSRATSTLRGTVAEFQAAVRAFRKEQMRQAVEDAEDALSGDVDVEEADDGAACVAGQQSAPKTC